MCVYEMPYKLLYICIQDTVRIYIYVYEIPYEYTYVCIQGTVPYTRRRTQLDFFF
jgi:hypothetical protein